MSMSGPDFSHPVGSGPEANAAQWPQASPGPALDGWPPVPPGAARPAGIRPEIVRAVLAAAAGGAAAIVLPKLPAPLPVVTGALACLPFAVGLLSLAVTELHHSSRADVCSALSAYQAASDSNSVSDSAWFAALTKAGNTAADYAGPGQAPVVASGKAALQLANGSGNSDVVITSAGQADEALAPSWSSATATSESRKNKVTLRNPWGDQ